MSSSFISFLTAETGLISIALQKTNASILSSKTLGIDLLIPFTHTKELSEILGTLLIMNIYRFPHYSLHFKEKTQSMVSPVFKFVQLERFQTILTNFSIGSTTDIMEYWETFLNEIRRTESDLFGNETLFLRKVRLLPLEFFLLYDEHGCLLDGIVGIIGSNDDGLNQLLWNVCQTDHRLILDHECTYEQEIAESMGLITELTDPKMQIKQDFGFDVLEEFDFLEEGKKNEIKATFLLLEHLLMKCFLKNTEQMNLQDFCEKIAKILLGIKNIKEKRVKTKKRKIIREHFPKKMVWCKKCKCCEKKMPLKGKHVKKTKYKCIQCSLENRRDVPLCLAGCFEEFHNQRKKL